MLIDAHGNAAMPTNEELLRAATFHDSSTRAPVDIDAFDLQPRIEIDAGLTYTPQRLTIYIPEEGPDGRIWRHVAASQLTQRPEAHGPAEHASGRWALHFNEWDHRILLSSALRALGLRPPEELESGLRPSPRSGG